MKQQKWFLRSAYATKLCGLLLVVCAWIPGALEPLLAVLFVDEAPVVVDTSARLASGVAGAVLTGWATFMALIVRRLGCLDAAAVSRALLTALAVWFVLDGSVSVVTGAGWNIVGNVVFLAMLGIPAWRLRGSATSRHDADGLELARP